MFRLEFTNKKESLLKKATSKRNILRENLRSDYTYMWHFYMNDPLTIKFINSIMRKGKRYIADRIFSKVIFRMRKEIRVSPIHILRRSILNCIRPFDVKILTLGKKQRRTIVIPLLVPQHKQVGNAIRTILKYAKERFRKSEGRVTFDNVLYASILRFALKRDKFFKETYRINKLAYDNRFRFKRRYIRFRYFLRRYHMQRPKKQKRI